MKCLDAGLAPKEEFKYKCHVQICALPQDHIYTHDDGGKEMLYLMDEAADRKGADVIRNTGPYVEDPLANQHANIEWIIELALEYSLHLGFHLDYNLDAKNGPSVYHIIQEPGKANWRN